MIKETLITVELAPWVPLSDITRTGVATGESLLVDAMLLATLLRVDFRYYHQVFDCQRC